VWLWAQARGLLPNEPFSRVTPASASPLNLATSGTQEAMT